MWKPWVEDSIQEKNLLNRSICTSRSHYRETNCSMETGHCKCRCTGGLTSCSEREALPVLWFDAHHRHLLTTFFSLQSKGRTVVMMGPFLTCSPVLWIYTSANIIHCGTVVWTCLCLHWLYTSEPRGVNKKSYTLFDWTVWVTVILHHQHIFRTHVGNSNGGDWQQNIEASDVYSYVSSRLQAWSRFSYFLSISFCWVFFFIYFF